LVVYGKQVYIKTPYVSNVADPDFNMLWLLVFLTVHGFGVQRFKGSKFKVDELVKSPI